MSSSKQELIDIISIWIINARLVGYIMIKILNYISINKNDIMYDLDKIKHTTKKAKELFKKCKHKLNKILKKLVNEHFKC